MKSIFLKALCTALAFTLMTSCASDKSDDSEQITEGTTVQERHIAEYDASKPVIALTFDDGPSVTTVSILDKLKKYNVVASFFVVGNNVNDGTADTVREAYNMGCEINNHSKTHAYMNKQTEAQILDEISFTSCKVEEITGEPPHFFRPPYIAVNDMMFDKVGLPFISGYGCEDWVATVTAEQRAERVIKQARDGAIILMHDSQGNNNTVAALDTIIPELQAKGYQFVTVSQLFEANNITPANRIIYSFAEQTTMYG